MMSGNVILLLHVSDKKHFQFGPKCANIMVYHLKFCSIRAIILNIRDETTKATALDAPSILNLVFTIGNVA